MQKWKIKKMDLPFEGLKWAIVDADDGELFGAYRTKADATADAKEYGLKLTR